MAKRTFDLIVSALAILLLFPVLLPVIIILRFTGEGEVFYRQKRIGLSGKPFFILKFATMLKDSPNLGSGDITVKEDPRVLPFGRFLRKTKINELPQLVNILLGDMSVIGPRPLTPRVLDLFPDDYKAVLMDVKPGLSGVGSIVFRDEEKLLSQANDHEKFYRENIVPQKTALEQWYKDNASLWTDLKLIFLTIVVVLFPGWNISHKLFPTLPEDPTLI